VIWVDAQLPPALARWLRELGAEAEHVQDLGLLAASDRTIFEAARRAGVWVITKDQDFVSLLDRFGPPPSVLWLTCGNLDNASLRLLIENSWPKVAELLAAGEPLIEIRSGA
jgi:predicted nuclease of predicted toxin-antitoxin system